MSLDEQYSFREALVAFLRRDLVGPDDPDEVETINDRPITKYAMGVLFPQSAASVGDDAPTDDEIEVDHADAAPDPAVAMANVRYPSSIGITFAVDTTLAGAVVVQARAACYIAEQTSEGPRRRVASGPEERWRRAPLSVAAQTLDVTQPAEHRLPLADKLELYARVRRADADGVTAVTLALVNKHEVDKGDRDPFAFFQVGLEVTAPDGASAFAQRPAPGTPDGDAEMRSYRLLFGHAPTYATGHGCAVEWEHEYRKINRTGSVGNARLVRTVFAPKHELRLSDSNPEIDTAGLGMHRLATATHDDVHKALHDLVSGYRTWIGLRRAQLDTIDDPDMRSTADEHLDRCDQACDRMAAGIKVLADPKAMQAFQLANRAMAMQRARTEWLKGDRTGQPDESGPEWRPFQLAFMLLCLPGIVDKNSADRSIADVLWFPTGGGKTEAYLGLIAFTTFLRRIRDPRDGGGVTVLMRYTMRLLTIQQFERAALLICCMERLRQTQLGGAGEQITIGMWVGQDATPNVLDRNDRKRPGAKQVLAKLAKKEPVEKGNPVQIRSCTWCGTAMDDRNYRVTAEAMVVACGTAGCDFASGLPVHLVDETLYAARPTLIIATADKLAGIPWKPEVANLFNKTTGQAPPELIIQDELHLISGPLGTLAGLYETAVDMAAERPKVVASTATIRRADRQGSALFDREVHQFPPPGTDSRDSYFSIEATPADKATRLYVGLMAPATSQTSLLVRAYAALLHQAQALPAADAVRDPYWTLLGYFNSLRLLAGAKLQVQDDVSDRLELLAELHDQPERHVLRSIELTSREPSSKIPDHLKDMSAALPGDAVDVILATNMISVGVDVDRLGLMVVMGQPQSTSEYIQATSRVGRKWPGLVVTLFNSARSRDRSHYENFASYHGALYRQVEATSVTPFSARARDRGLHAAVIGLARLLIPAARPRGGAARIADFEDELRRLCDTVLERVGRVAGDDERAATAKQIDDIIAEWMRRADDEPDLVYDDYREPGNGLLIDAGRYDESDDEISETMPTLWSLRDVDVETKLYLEKGRR